MKKTAIALAVAIAGFATTVQAAPQDNSWYVGGKLGWSSYSGTTFSNDVDSDFAGYKMRGKNQIGTGAFVGYQYNQYMGLEIGYDWLGRMNKLPSALNSYSAKYSAQGIQLAAKFSYPVMSDVDLYTRLGGLVWRGESKLKDPVSGNYSNSHYSVSPLAAAGVEYAWDDNWALRLDYQYTWDVGDYKELGIKPNNSLLSVGLSYRFGSAPVAAPAAPAPMAAPTPAPAPTVETKRFTLNSDVLFNFNSHTLKAEGHHALNELHSKLSAMDATEGSVVVVGYTDRIGSESYNHKLSEQRARSVVDYLVSKGIPAESISSRGMGKSDPVTGSKCEGIKNRKALIACLAPDRRVEIEVEGSQQQVAQ